MLLLFFVGFFVSLPEIWALRGWVRLSWQRRGPAQGWSNPQCPDRTGKRLQGSKASFGVLGSFLAPQRERRQAGDASCFSALPGKPWYSEAGEDSGVSCLACFLCRGSCTGRQHLTGSRHGGSPFHRLGSFTDIPWGCSRYFP